MTIEKLDLSTPDIVDENVVRIAALFPGVVTEGKDDDGKLTRVIDFDALKQELSDNIVEGPQERYRLDWPGKREAMLAANTPISKTLRPVREESVDFDTTKNLFIEGDNLDALKLLQETYLGKIKMIYIDPPYNTGKDFIYKDNFTQDKSEYLEESGQLDEEGGRLVTNAESSGRYHSDWLSMMYPRLKLARNLLKDDGVIFISIDDGEVAGLKKLCDEIFGNDNFIADIVWQKRTSPDMRKAFSTGHDHILFYARNIIEASAKINKLPLSDAQKSRYKNPDKDPKGPWVSSDFTAQGFRPNQMYDICTPGGAVHSPPDGRCWKNIEPVFEDQLKDGRFWFGVDGKGVPRRKNYLSETAGVNPWSWWTNKEVGHNQEAKKEINSIFGVADIFQTPKPVRLLMRMLTLTTEENDVVLDFFAGSASLAHAAMETAINRSSNLKTISIQIPEAVLETERAFKAGYATISELSKERIRRAGNQMREENPIQAGVLDFGFRVLKIDTSNLNDVHNAPDTFNQEDLLASVENIKTDRTAEDLLFQVMLNQGIDLSLPIAREILAGKPVYFVGDDALAACFDKDITEDVVKAMADRKPLYAIFRDDGFPSDDMKINTAQLFKQMTDEHTRVKVI